MNRNPVDLQEKFDKSEKALQAALQKSKSTLGPSAPRLLTEKPQVAANCIRHGLTGETVFLTPMKMRDYLAAGLGYIQDLKPITHTEVFLAQRIIDAEWRLCTAASLATTCQTSAVILESQAIFENNPHLLQVKEGSLESEHILAHSNAAAIRRLCEGSNLFEKLDRHETRLWRLICSMRQEYERIYKRIPATVREEWTKDLCPSYEWYKELADLADDLLEARYEMMTKSEVEISPIRHDGTPVTDPESEPSGAKLFCKKRLKMMEPLDWETLQIFKKASRVGLTTELEETIFPELA
jgi:hypothetical protein